MVSEWRGEDADIAGVSRRLRELSRGLSGNAGLVYQSLQRALEVCCTAGVGAQVDFGDCFWQGLLETFEDQQVEVRRVGGARSSQWEVTVGGARIFCSVRLSVLGDDAGLLAELRSKARVVKDVLKESNLGQPDAKGLEAFRRECAERAVACGCAGPGRPLGGAPGASPGESEDMLSAVLGARVVASFECELGHCRHAWTTYNGRLQPDGTLRRQYCVKCGGVGIVKASRPYMAADSCFTGGRQQGMHQSNLCEACRDFGNCMGIFDDPFVVSTALSLIFDTQVQWGSHSETPELLVARLGGLGAEQLQVCLQPHVFEALPAPAPGSLQPRAARFPGGGALRPAARARASGAPARQPDPRAPRAGEPAAQLTIKNPESFQEFLALGGPRPPARSGAGSAGSGQRAGAPPPHTALASGGTASAALAATGAPPASALRGAGGPTAPTPAGQPGSASTPSDHADCRAAVAGGGGAVARKAGRNKITPPAAAAAPTPTAAPTPYLDRLTAGMRRHQLVAAAMGGLCTAGELGAESIALAEHYLAEAKGDFMQALRKLHHLGLAMAQGADPGT